MSMVAFHHTLLEILAGGPGSGCRGPKCGRPKGQGVKQTFQSPQGFTYTLLKPSRKGIEKGSHKWQAKKDQFRGQYKVARDAQNKPIKHESKSKDVLGQRYSNVYDAAWGRGDKWEGQGKTVFVHRDFKNMRVVVQEVPHDEMQKSETMRVWKFKNFGQAAGFLNRRYGIRQKLPRVIGR